MKKLLIVVLVAALGAGVMALVVCQRDAAPEGSAQLVVPSAHGRQKAPWEPYGFQCRDAPKRRRYNLPVLIQVNGHPAPNVRLLLDMEDPANYYFVEFTKDVSRIGKVESGLEADIGTTSPRGLRLKSENKVVVKRRRDSIAVVLNDALVARAEDEAFHGGQVGAGVLDQSAIVGFGSPQPCDAVDFADDFMKGPAEDGGWTTVAGSWDVAEIRNPSLSSNAFYYVGTAAGGSPPAAAVRGQWFWDDYRLRVACASLGTQDVGVFFYYRDPANYYLLRWNAAKQPDGTGGRKQLIKRWHGEDTVLAEQPGGYQPSVWYELVVEVVGQRIRAFIDGHELFTMTDDDLCFGKIGLHTATPSPAAAHFDDVVVQPVRAFEDAFATVAARRWRPLGGSWEQRRDGDTSYCFVSTRGPAKAVAGSSRWRDYTAAATLRLPPKLTPKGEVGVVAHYLDEMNYALFAWNPAAGTARLEALVEGERVVAERVEAPQAPAATRHILGLAFDHGVVSASLDGQPMASGWAPGLPKGKVGLFASAVADLAFDRVQVAFPLPPQPVLTSHEVFSREYSMSLWSGAASDWQDTAETIDGQALQPHWHRADFFGDATMEVEVKDEAAKAAASGAGVRACRLVLAADSTETVCSGYNFVFTWPTTKDAKAPCKAVLTRGKKVVAEKDVALDGPVSRLRLQRIGHHLIASVGYDPVLTFKDHEPLTGPRAAYATVGLPVPRKHVSVFSDNVQVYTFSRASTDWRTAAGTWQVTNRWQCDPRWSFFSGVPDSSKLVAIWNKHAFEGDVSVEFAVGPKMAGERGGSYTYVRDFNVTICADGKDLTSGYSFLFGGWNNARTGILRGTKLLAPSSHVIARSGIHRRWFYVKVEKRGNTLNYWIDGSRVLSVQDPKPLTGTRMAIWSWDCAIMVARVRISATRIGAKEPPEPRPGPCRTIYSLGR